MTGFVRWFLALVIAVCLTYITGIASVALFRVLVDAWPHYRLVGFLTVVPMIGGLWTATGASWWCVGHLARVHAQQDSMA
jgi:hypothetical protein